jgi:hypothetical protein
MFIQKQLLKGCYSWEIINPDGSIAAKSKEKNNLILNQGLDYVSSRSFADCFLYCAIGYGNVAPLLTDTGLLNEVKRSGTIQSSLSSVGTNSYNIKRVFDFSPETETVFYGEIGWSPEESAGNNLFSRTQMVDQNGNVGPLAVNRLQFLRVTYTLSITFSPASLTVNTPSIVGWTTDGNASCQYIGLNNVNLTGGSGFADIARDAAEPSNSIIDIFIASGTQTPSGLGTGASYTNSWSQRAILIPYVSGSYTKNFYAIFGRNSGVGTFSTIGCGLTGFAPSRPIYAHVMNSPQTKAADYELGVYFTYQWGRA